MKGVGADEEDVFQEGVGSYFVDVAIVGQVVLSGCRPLLGRVEGLLQLRHGVGTVDACATVRVGC